MKEKVIYAHLHQRLFMPGINKQIEKGVNQETCPGIEMNRVETGDVEWKFKGFRGYWSSTLFQCLICEEPTTKKEVAVDPIKTSKKAA